MHTNILWELQVLASQSGTGCLGGLGCGTAVTGDSTAPELSAADVTAPSPGLRGSLVFHPTPCANATVKMRHPRVLHEALLLVFFLPTLLLSFCLLA